MTSGLVVAGAVDSPPAAVPPAVAGRAPAPAGVAVSAARYHSLCVDPATLPDALVVTATSPADGVVMGIRHATLPLEGVQFHPESVLTPEGPHLLANFLRLAGEGEADRLDAATGSFATAGLETATTPDELRPDGTPVGVGVQGAEAAAR